MRRHGETTAIYSSHEVGTREVPYRTLPQASALSTPPVYSHRRRGPVMGSPGVAVAELSGALCTACSIARSCSPGCLIHSCKWVDGEELALKAQPSSWASEASSMGLAQGPPTILIMKPEALACGHTCSEPPGEKLGAVFSTYILSSLSVHFLHTVSEDTIAKEENPAPVKPEWSTHSEKSSNSKLKTVGLVKRFIQVFP